MRPPVPTHKTVFLRFHVRVDEMLEAFSEKTGMRRATAVVWIQSRYMQKLLAGDRDITTLTMEELGFSGTEEAYFPEPGRRSAGGKEGSMLGRAMQITVDKYEDRMLELIAMQHHMSTRNFRTAILVQYFEEIGIIS